LSQSASTDAVSVATTGAGGAYIALLKKGCLRTLLRHVTGLPKTVVMTSEEIREAIAPAVGTIVEAVRNTLDPTPPQLVSDIMDRGMILAGGGALLRHLDERLRKETGVPVHVAEEPLTCVARGSGRFLEAIDFYQGSIALD
jgi:rod shape-determining protein MreB and related proteins